MITSTFTIFPSLRSDAGEIGTVDGILPENNFGSSVNNAGDINGDGVDDIVMGAPGYAGNTGSVYIYYGGFWSDNNKSAFEANVTISGGTPGDLFGLSVDGAGDFNNDGYKDIIIGAPGNNSGSGSAYIFHGGKTIAPFLDVGDANLTFYDVDLASRFGNAVAGAGDVNDDDFDDVLIGAPYHDDWWNSLWFKRMKLTIDMNKIPGVLDNFPVMVKLDPGRFDYGMAQFDGSDLRFIDPEGKSELKYHIESWNASGDSYIWVNVSKIDPAANNNFIWLYYNNSGALDAQDGQGTYDSDFITVWHLNGSSGPVLDQTRNDHDGTALGGLNRNASGVVDGAFDLAGDDDYLEFGSDPQLMVTGNITLEAWMNIDSTPVGFDYGLMQFGNSGEAEANNWLYMLQLTPGTSGLDIRIGHEYGSGTDQEMTYNTDLPLDNWYYLAATRDVFDSTWKLFINGFQFGDPYIYTNDPTGGSSGTLMAGKDWFNPSWRYSDGSIDEIRISSSTRDSEWIRSQYLIMTDNILSYGISESIKTDTGAVYIFQGRALEDAVISSKLADNIFTGSSELGNFGFSVSGAGNINSDPFDDIIIGAPGEDRAYIFYGGAPMNTWVQNTEAEFQNHDRTVQIEITNNDDGEIELETFNQIKAVSVFSEQSGSYFSQNRSWDQESWGDKTTINDHGGDKIIWSDIISGSVRKNEKIQAMSDDGNDINVKVSDGLNWVTDLELTDVLSDAKYKGFDLAYESLSGDGMVAYFNNSDPGVPNMIPRYRIFNGSSWSSEQSAQSLGSSDILMLELASDPYSDEILMITLNSDSDLYAQVWNGSEWWNLKLIESSVSRNDMRSFDVIYEQQSGNGMVVWGGDPGSNKNMNYRRWTGNWDESPGNLVTADNQVNWVRLAADPKTDHIISANLDNGRDIDVQVWDGVSWSLPEVEVTGDSERNTETCFDIAWESKGFTEGLIVYTINQDDPVYRTINGTVVSPNVYDVANSAPDGDRPNWLELESDPQSDDIVLYWLEDDGGGSIDDITSVIWDGSKWIDVEAITTDSDRDDGQHFDMGITDASGYFISVAYDAGVQGGWGRIRWNASVPSETGLEVRTRTSADNVTWSPWSDRYQNGDMISSKTGRWVQYMVILETANITLTPVLFDIQLELSHADIVVNGTAGEGFGYDVSDCGDVNGDGRGDIIIGAPLNNANCGAAYLFMDMVSATGCYLKASTDSNASFEGENSDDNFGAALGYASNFNGDIYSDLIIGAPNASGTGKIYVFHGSDTISGIISALDANFTGSGENADDGYGFSVSSSGNIDGYYYDDILIGSPNRDNVSNEGRAYILTSDQFMNISWIKIFDMSETEGSSFVVGDPIRIRVNVSSPYDLDGISKINVTIIGPNSTVFLFEEPMVHEGSFIDQPEFWNIYYQNFTNPTKPGNYTVIIKALKKNGVIDTRSTSYDLMAGEPSKIEILPDPSSLVADGLSQTNITIKIFDKYGNPLNGLATMIITSLEAGSGIFDTVMEQGNGVYNVTFTADTVSEPDATINISIGGVSNTTLIDLKPGPLYRIGLTPSSLDIVAGTSRTFTATGFDEHDNIVVLSGTSWTTDIGFLSDETNTKANLTASTTIKTGYVKATQGAISTTASVNVIPDVLDRIVVTPGFENVTAGEIKTFSASGFDKYGNAVTINPSWSTTVGIMSQATLQAKTVVCEGYVNASVGNIIGTSAVTIIPDELYLIIVTPGIINIEVGSTYIFNASGFDRYDNHVPIVPIWTTTVGVMVSSVLTAREDPWIGYVNATYANVVGSAIVNLIAAPLDHITIDPKVVEVVAGGSYKFAADGFDRYGNSISVAPIWTTNVGVLTGATLHAHEYLGSGNVNATVHLNDEFFIDSAIVSIIPGPLQSIQIDPERVDIVVGTLQEFSAKGYDQFNNDIDIFPAWDTDAGSMIGNVLVAQIQNGTGVVIASQGGISGIASVNIIPDVLDHITVTPGYLEIQTGNSHEFSAEGFDKYNNLIQVQVEWSTNAGEMFGNLFVAQNIPGNGVVTAVAVTNVTENIIKAVSNVIVKLAGNAGSGPRIVSVIPDQERYEDSDPWELDLSPYKDHEGGSKADLRWYVTGENNSLFILSGEKSPEDKLKFTPVPDAFGSNKIILWLEDDSGGLAFQSIWVNLTPVNDPPTIYNAPDLILRFDESYTFDYKPYIYDIDNADEELVIFAIETVTDSNTKVNGFNVTYNYPSNLLGQTTLVTIEVTDGEDSGKDLIQISITDDYVPILELKMPDLTLYEGTMVENVFNLNDYFSDRDEDSLYYSYGQSHVTVIINTDGSIDVASPSEWSGTEEVTFRAEDPMGALAEDTIKITVIPINDPPLISGVPDLVVHYDHDYKFDLTNYVSDKDNDSRELVLTTSVPSYIRFDRINNMLMVINYPESMLGLKMPVTITVFDGSLSNWQKINITVSDDFPPENKRQLQDIEFEEDSELIDIFDLDEFFIDIDGDSLFYSSGHSNIKIIIDVNNKVSFSSELNWFGTEEVKFRAEDPSGAIAEDLIKVTVIPVNDAPALSAIPIQKGKTGDYWVLDLEPYLDDVDNNLTDIVVSVSNEKVIVNGLKLVFHSESELNEFLIITVSDGNKNTSGSFKIVIEAGEEAIPISKIFNWIIIIIVMILILSFLAVFRKYKGNYKIDEVYLIYENGALLAHKSRFKSDGDGVDEIVLSGMLTAVVDFIKEGFQQNSYVEDITPKSKGKGPKIDEWKIQELQLAGHNIFLEHGKYSYLAVIYSGKSGWKLTRYIKEMIGDIETKYEVLSDWDGDKGGVKGIESTIEGLFSK